MIWKVYQNVDLDFFSSILCHIFVRISTNGLQNISIYFLLEFSISASTTTSTISFGILLQTVVFQKGENIIMQYNSSYGQAKGMKKLEHQLKDGDRRKFGQITLEVKTSPEPSNRIISTH